MKCSGKFFVVAISLLFEQTFSVAQTAPGGVTGFGAWYRGDNSSNTNSVWQNQSGLNNTSVMTGSGWTSPTLNSSGTDLLNFNQTYTFGSSQHFVLPSALNVGGSGNGFSFFGIAKMKGGSNGRVFSSWNTNHLFGYWYGLENTLYMNTNPFYLNNGSNNVIAASTNPGLFSLLRTTSGVLNQRKNGTLANTSSTSDNTVWQAQLNGFYDGESSQVIIGEFISYPTDQSAAVNQIESYLALKYGITKSGNYIASDGITTVWSASANSTYSNNIAGIACDNTTLLYQKQSMSQNTGQQVLIGAGSLLANTNAAHTGTLNNGQYLVWGNNGGAAALTVTVTGISGISHVMGRIWKVQNTGGTGKVRVAWQAGITNIKLVQSTDIIFNGSDIVTDMSTNTQTINGITYNYADVTLSNGQFFTFAGVIPNPGGITGATLWYKGDAVSDITLSGSNVTQWNNKAVSGTYHLVQQGASGTIPAYNSSSNLINFNQSLRFDGVNDRLYAPGVPQASTLGGSNASSNFIVYRYNGSGSGNVLYNHSDGAGSAWNLGAQDGGAFVIANRAINSTAAVNNEIRLQEVDGNTSTASTYVNGVLKSNTLSSSAAVAGTQPFWIGAQGSSYPSNSDIAELIVYPSAQTSTTNRRQIESYLSLKYGITMGSNSAPLNYVNSAGTTVWSVSANTYHSNVAGIVRDDASGLYQKQSISQNTGSQVLIGAGGLLDNTNTGNTNALTNGQYLVWGDNGGVRTLTTSVTGIAGVNFIMGATWKVQNTGAVGTVRVAWPVGINNLKLIQSSDAVFTSSDVVTDMSSTTQTINGLNYNYTDVTLSDGQFFTFAGLTVAPGGVTANLSLWLEANKGLSTTGSNVTAWLDQSGINTFSVVGTPVYNSSSVNYNPTVEFNGSSYFPGNTTIANSTEAFALASINNPTGTNLSGAVLSNNFTTSGDYFFHTEGGTFYTGNPANYTCTNLLSNNIPLSIMNADLSETPALNNTIRVNGGAYSNTCADPGPYNRVPVVGGRSTTEPILNGSKISEVILYTASTSGTNRFKINSYLALKYGITLPHDYILSGGTTAYKIIDTYSNTIIGITRDDPSALIQKQSKTQDDSVRIYLAGLATINTGNTGSFGTDQQSVIIGSNAGVLRSAAATVAEIPTGLGIYSRLNREWKITNTNFNGTFSIDIKLNTSPVTASDLRVLIDDDGNFTNATMYNPGITYSGGIVTVTGLSTAHIPINSTKFFTLVSLNNMSPLPVELVSFEGSCTDDNIHLHWTTASEKNNTLFVLEKSTDAIYWKEIIKREGNGTSGSSKYYTAFDSTYNSGIIYYRLKQVDTDAKFTYSPIISVDCQSKDSPEVSVYPNPFDDKLLIHNTGSKRLHHRIYTPLGQIVMDGDLEPGTEHMNVVHLAAGIYFFNIYDDTTLIKTIKLIK